MAVGVNKVILVGNLGRDPEIRFSQGGAGVCTFSLATTESYKNKEGVRVEHTEWHNIVIFGKLAEVANEYLHKGKQVYLEGKIKTEEYEKDGEKKSIKKIICYQMQMLGSRSDGDTPAGKDKESTSATDDFQDVPF